MGSIEGTGWFAILCARGLLLWIVLPFAFLAWMLVHIWVQHATLKQALAWYDGILFAVLTQGPFRLMVPAPRRVRFVGPSGMREIVPHKGFDDGSLVRPPDAQGAHQEGRRLAAE